MASSSSSGTSSSTPKWEYDVFLSFAGKDTRLKFTDHLYDAFTRSGIKCFKDDVDLPKGENIDHLFQAIQDSLCSVFVISPNYANSKWCLDELQTILDSRKKLGRWVFPIFYNVNPSDVRHQGGSFKKAMAEHEEKFIDDPNKVQNWRTALSEIGKLSGYVTTSMREAYLMKNIVGDVWTYICSKLPSYDDNLVGIDSRLANDLMPFLDIGSNEVHFIGIWGMGGVGKTTLARVVSEKLSYKFEICCFLSNVRETLLHRDGRVTLQKQILSHLKIMNMEIYNEYYGMKMIRNRLCNKKVLLVLDDVDHVNDLKNLAESPNWFGKGSRIIITTRERHVLIAARVKRIYEMKTMEKYESLQLFCNKAFDKDYPEENFSELSEFVVEYAGGLPLALEVLGSFLCGRSEDQWRDALDRLKRIPDNDIHQKLKISYDGLNEEEKAIFLDIACFFNGWRKTKVTQILKACDFHSKIGIKVLIEKSLLVKTKYFTLQMHDLLVELGRHIVDQESPNVKNRSRLWKPKDIKEVLENNQGSEAIQAMVDQDFHTNESELQVHPKAFSKMSTLRILILLDKRIGPDSIILPRALKHFGASKLKVLQWRRFPFSALPLPLNELVHIQMPSSNIKQLWNGNPLMDKLKFINLHGSNNFAITPDFSRVPFLEYLDLSDCESLVEVHSSLGNLKELVEVSLKCCRNLETLPTRLETNSLIKLDLSHCSKVTMLPEFGEGMKKFSYLDVTFSGITELPESLGSLIGLKHIKMDGCKILNLDTCLKTHITSQISSLNLTSLTELYLTRCRLNDRLIPNDFGSLSSLIVLDLEGNDFVNIPTECFSRLSRLVFLSLARCWKLGSLPRLPPRLSQLRASNCHSLEPLSDTQSWNLIASLGREDRGRSKHVVSFDKYHDYKHVEQECLLPLRDFFAVISRREIPSWFPNEEYFPMHAGGVNELVTKVNIPPHFRDSKWSGIVVCFGMAGMSTTGYYGHILCYNLRVTWSSKAPEDGDYMPKDWAHYFPSMSGEELCIMVLELNEETCWQHLSPTNNILYIKLFFRYTISGRKGPSTSVLEKKWRVICKEEIQSWCNDNHLNQITLPQLDSSHDEINIPYRVLHRFIKKMPR